jgi:hypothetical protein
MLTLHWTALVAQWLMPHSVIRKTWHRGNDFGLWAQLGKGRRGKKLEPPLRTFAGYFEGSNRSLEQVPGQDFSMWKKYW